MLTDDSYGVRNARYLDWLLSQGADPNAVSAFNETVLSLALREGTMKVVKKLLALDTIDTSCGDLLHCVAQREPSTDIPSLVDVLVTENHAQIDAYEFDNEVARQRTYGFPLGTALHVACENENIPAIQALLHHGANPHQLQKQCDRLVEPTPLQMVCGNADLEALMSRYSQGTHGD